MMMMRSSLLLIAFIALLASCKQKKAEQTDHIPPATMGKIMVDVHLAETYSSLVKDTLHPNNPGMKNQDSLAAFYKAIFAHYKITEQQFATSLAWYKDHPDDLDTVYNDMIPVITNWQAAHP